MKEVLTPETQRELTEVSKERHLPAGFCKKQTLKKKNALSFFFITVRLMFIDTTCLRLHQLITGADFHLHSS